MLYEYSIPPSEMMVTENSLGIRCILLAAWLGEGGVKREQGHFQVEYFAMRQWIPL